MDGIHKKERIRLDWSGLEKERGHRIIQKMEEKIATDAIRSHPKKELTFL